MENSEILDKIQEKILEIHNNANKALINLNKREGKNFQHVKGAYDCDLNYYRDVARFAWAERAKQIVAIEMQSFLNDIREEINKKQNHM